MPDSPPPTRATIPASAPRGTVPHRASEAYEPSGRAAPPTPAGAAWPEQHRLPHSQAVLWRAWDYSGAYIAMLVGALLITTYILWPVLTHIAGAGGLPVLLRAFL